MDKIDILFLGHEREEFTRAAHAALVANTNWSRVHRVVIYDDGAAAHLPALLKFPVYSIGRSQRLGGPVAIMNDFLGRSGAAVFAKIDNDVIVPPSWLDAALDVMASRTELGLLGLEPPMSRTPAPWAPDRRHRIPEWEDVAANEARGYAPCDAIGGVGVMRRSVFDGGMQPRGIYGGFTDWQLRHPEIGKGWICPPLNLFLLDRLPMEPWASLSREYIAKGWQRAWTNYGPEAAPLWSWWATDAVHD